MCVCVRKVDSSAEVAELNSLSQRRPCTHRLFDLATKLITMIPTELVKALKWANGRYHPPAHDCVASNTCSTCVSDSRVFPPPRVTAKQTPAADGLHPRTLIHHGSVHPSFSPTLHSSCTLPPSNHTLAIPYRPFLCFCAQSAV